MFLKWIAFVSFEIDEFEVSEKQFFTSLTVISIGAQKVNPKPEIEYPS